MRLSEKYVRHNPELEGKTAEEQQALALALAELTRSNPFSFAPPSREQVDKIAEKLPPPLQGTFRDVVSRRAEIKRRVAQKMKLLPE